MPEMNLFMICAAPEPSARGALPAGFYFDNCRPDELEIWKAFPFDNPDTAAQYQDFMTDYFNNVYASQKARFFERCLFVRDTSGKSVATGFVWKAYDSIYTLHWIKTLREYENMGIGRALLTRLLLDDKSVKYPVYLHTQPESYRAIKLYSDFGFALITDRQVGPRVNHLTESMDYLKAHMPPCEFAKLRFAAAPAEFLRAVSSSPIDEF